MFIKIISAVIFLVGFHLAADFISRKLNIPNRYLRLRTRLERGEKLPIALLKFVTDHIVFGLTVVWLLLPMLFNVHSTQKSYGELEAEKEARAQAMVDEYGGKLADYL